MNFYAGAVAAERAWPSRAGPGLRGPPRRPRSPTDGPTRHARSDARPTGRTGTSLTDALHARTARPTHTQRSTAGRRAADPSVGSGAGRSNKRVQPFVGTTHVYFFPAYFPVPAGCVRMDELGPSRKRGKTLDRTNYQRWQRTMKEKSTPHVILSTSVRPQKKRTRKKTTKLLKPIYLPCSPVLYVRLSSLPVFLSLHLSPIDGMSDQQSLHSNSLRANLV